MTFSVDAKRDTLAQGLTLLKEILREPAFPDEEFDVNKSRMRSMLSNGRTEPLSLASNKLSRSLSPYLADDVRYSPTLEESLARIKSVHLSEIKKLYQTQLGASKVEVGIVGEFDPAATVKQIKDMLAGWTSKVPIERIDHKIRENVKGSSDDIITPDKSNAEYLAGLSFAMTDNDADYPAMLLGNYIFGGSTLASRIGDRIRQKDGLSYGASSGFTASSHDPVASLTITVSTNPINIGKVTADVKEELEKFRQGGPTQTELADAKQAFIEARKVGRTSDEAIAAQIASNLELGRTFAHAAKQEKDILALTPEKVKEAFAKHAIRHTS